MTFPFPPAPFPGLDDAQRAAMLALGPTWAQDIQENRRRVCDIYDAIHGALPADDLRVARRAYGDDPRQQLDLYLPIGDPERIVLLGHSAGGSHVATFLTDPAKGQAQA